MQEVEKELRKHYRKPSFLPDSGGSVSMDWIFMGGSGVGAPPHVSMLYMYIISIYKLSTKKEGIKMYCIFDVRYIQTYALLFEIWFFPSYTTIRIINKTLMEHKPSIHL